MKRLIEWHEECLRNEAIFLLQRMGALKRERAEFEKSMAAHNHYAAQIKEAKRMKRSGFDSDRFMKKKVNS
jgi:16S rRNA G527 N7-methylase RsmG